MVTFFLVNPTREKSAISILVSFYGKIYRRSTGESIPVKMWNKTKKRAKVTADFPHGNMINDMLDKWEAAALKTISHFKEYYNPPVSEKFFTQLDKDFYKDDASVPRIVLFTEYLEIYITRYKTVRAETTIEKYITALNKLKEYEKEKRRKLYFENININFYNDFQHWFYKRSYSDNYFGAIIKIIKQIYREARLVDKLHDCQDIQHRDFIAVNKNTENVYLTEEELLKIHRLNISPELILSHFPDLSDFRVQQKIQSLSLVKDRFLIGAYTGLRVSDFGRLNKSNIGKHIRIKTLKTGTNTVIPIHPVIREIIDNGFDPDVTISDQKINVHIKEIAQLAGINDTIVVHKHVAGEIKQEIKEKYKLISSHTARRSFATNAYKAGIPTIAIMKITGHRKESTFLKYIKISEEENADMLMNHPFFNGGYAEHNAEQENPNKSDILI